ncbi:endo-1,3(4)-beta-glucanase [Aureobasidium sp. EXF-12298]|nr:endo-1,3(4)-beta-glucanase [Aureobasidium sp. EXF-12298]
MPLIPFLFTLFSFVNLSIAGYALQDDYNSAAFFDMFDFFTEADPTHGFVQYIDQGSAWNSGLIGNSNGKVYIGVDHTNVQPNGRPSIRLTSKKAYNSGSLVILDLDHMPGNACGAWPAYWMVGPSWPNGGEIDIIEGVNTQNHNAMTLHTADGCNIYDNGNFTGNLYSDDCYVNAADQSNNLGCQISTNQYNTYGDGFNNVGGGVYAMEWTDEAISIWFFQRGAIPSNVLSSNPQPDYTWGKPLSQFTGCCDIPEFFSDNQIVFDVTFCGDWAGSVWSSDSTCSALSGSCTDYVANNPQAFSNAYWSINSLKVFEQTAKSSGKVALPAFCTNNNYNPTQTETFISSASTISTETAPAETTSTVSSAAESTTAETLSTQTSSAEPTSSTAETSSIPETSSTAESSSTDKISTTATTSSSAAASSSTASSSGSVNSLSDVSSTAQSSSSNQISSSTASASSSSASSSAAAQSSKSAQSSSAAQGSSAAQSSSAAQASSVAAKSSAKTASVGTSPAPASTAETAAETSSSQTLPSFTNVLTTLVLAVAADATHTEWSTVTTTLRQVVSVSPLVKPIPTEQPSATENSETTPAANAETTPTVQSFAETTVLTTIVQAVSADATTTQWVTLTTSIERAVTAPADTTTTQWTTRQVTVAPVYTTQWTTITSYNYQKAKRTALPESLMLGGDEASQTLRTEEEEEEASPSPSRRWLPRYWGRTGN